MHNTSLLGIHVGANGKLFFRFIMGRFRGGAKGTAAITFSLVQCIFFLFLEILCKIKGIGKCPGKCNFNFLDPPIFILR